VKRIVIKGPALSASGYGEQCRFALKSLMAHEERFEIYLENISWGKTGWIPMDSEERNIIDHLIGKTMIYVQQGGTFDISLQVTIPNEWDPNLAPYNVGYTAGIETTRISPQWIEASNKMDKIIVVSNHAKAGFDHTVYKARNEQTGEEKEFRTTTPIEVVNYALRKSKPAKLDLELENDFNFLTVCQWGPRKNLEATIVSFMEEFHDEDVGLVVKTNIARNNEMDRQHCRLRFDDFLANFPDRKCKLYLVHGNLSSEEMAGLYTHPKIKGIVSTTHGEGFGLPLFEAVCHGLPVIAPNWSGQVDFLYAPVKDKKTKKIKQRPHFLKVDFELKQVQQQAVWDGVVQADSKWCFVKKSSVKQNMRNLFKELQKRQSLAKKLQKYVIKKFEEEAIFEQFATAVHESEDAWENDLDEIAEV